MNPGTTSETWRLVELKLDILRQRTHEGWQNQDWELAALGERVIRTTEQSLAATGEMHQCFDELQARLADAATATG